MINVPAVKKFHEISDIIEDNDLFKSSESILSYNFYFKKLKRYPLLSKDEEYELALKIKEGDKKARNLMINSNLRLVIIIAKKFIGRGLLFDDLIMEGNIGLMKAVDKFIPKKGFRFSTYAMWWIRQSIERGISTSGRLIRIPIHVLDNLSKCYKATKEIESKLERKPYISEIGERTGIKERKLEGILNSNFSICSLDYSYEGNDENAGHLGGGLLNYISDDEESTSPYEILKRDETLEILNKCFLSLNPLSRKILILRYGLNGANPKTLNEIGLMFGLTKERIRQIEVKAISMLKKSLKD